MKLQIINLSDIHLKDRKQCHSVDIDGMVKAINSIEAADEFIIALSGDIASSGSNSEYDCADSLIGGFFKIIKKKYNLQNRVGFVCVPGNHDISFEGFDISVSDINRSFECNETEDLLGRYTKRMKPFFDFSRKKKCFLENTFVSRRLFEFEGNTVGFVLVNSGPLSLLGGNADDMGKHYLPDRYLDEVDEGIDADVRILIMHHSIEWFTPECKRRLRKIILKKYSLLLTGHEHEPFGEGRIVNDTSEYLCIQGNALCGYASEGNGFCSVNIDFDKNRLKAYSFIEADNVYIPQVIADREIILKGNTSLPIKSSFLNEIRTDNLKRIIDDFYVFPGLTYNSYNEKNEAELNTIDSEEELYELIEGYHTIMITGERKYGKTVLAKRMFSHYISLGRLPVLITASEINKKKIEKTVEYAFNDQYETKEHAYEKYIQADKREKIILLDEANLINKTVFDSLMDYLETVADLIIVFSEEILDLDIKKQVLNVVSSDVSINLSIKPFLYVKRKKLIENVLSRTINDENEVRKESRKINDMINTQIKYFDLDPEFIVNFVNQFENNSFQFSSGLNVFNVVYENSIKSRIINNSENLDPTLALNILREMAFYMHFNKKSYINLDELAKVVEQYEKNYRQRVNLSLFLKTATNAKILFEDSNKLFFKEHTLTAYFVAQALNQKNNQDEDISVEVYYLLKNLCFNINSDIVLFLALITNNPKFIKMIMEGARAHFDGKEEMSFEKGNLSYLKGGFIPVKETLPNNKEARKREAELERAEKDAQISDLIELVNEYDYTDEDLEKIENQVMISFKYIEILSKSLPAFCQNMKVDLQDQLVSLIYSCPNRFLFAILNDIGESFDEFCDGIYDEVSALRKEKNVSAVSLESVRKVVEQVSAVLVIATYQFVASTSATERSVMALNAFDYTENINYEIQNFIMRSRVDDVQTFSRCAIALDNKLNKKHKLERSILRYVVREYFLRNDIEAYGSGQALMDRFFPKASREKLKMEMAKRRIINKDKEKK